MIERTYEYEFHLGGAPTALACVPNRYVFAGTSRGEIFVLRLHDWDLSLCGRPSWTPLSLAPGVPVTEELSTAANPIFGIDVISGSSGRSLAVGREGRIDLIRLPLAEKPRVSHSIPAPGCVRFVHGFGTNRILLSYVGYPGSPERSGCQIYVINKDGLATALDQIRDVRFVFPKSARTWLLLSEAAEFWTLSNGVPQRLKPHIGEPSLIAVGASELPHAVMGVCAFDDELIVSTDAGIFRCRQDRERMILHPIRTAGAFGLPLAIASGSVGGRRYVWASDSQFSASLLSLRPDGSLSILDSVRKPSPYVRSWTIEHQGSLIVIGAHRNEALSMIVYSEPAVAATAAIELQQESLGVPVIPEPFDVSAENRGRLWQFLNDPEAESAATALERQPAGDRAKHVRRWTESVVGGLLRLQPRRLDERVRAVRIWLNRLRREVLDWEDAEAVEAEIDRLREDTHRWTLMAPTPEEAPFHLASAQRRPAHDGKRSQPDILEEELVSAALLFDRQRDDEEVIDLGFERNGRPEGVPFCVAYAEAGDRSRVAVLWRRSVIRIFDMRHEVTHEPFGLDPSYIDCREAVRSVKGSAIDPKSVRFGRAIAIVDPQALGHAADPHLLFSIRSRPTGAWDEEEILCLYSLHEHTLVASATIGKGSVYSLYSDQRRPFVFAGIRDDQGRGQVLRIELKNSTNGPSLVVVRLLRRSLGFGSRQLRSGINPVRCLARVDKSHDDGFYDLVAGCASGQVMLLRSAVTASPGSVDPQEVGRLSTPVWSVACRHTLRGRRRVHAGTADGSIFTWQELPREESQSEDPAPRFGVLSGTRERGPIVALMSFPARLTPARLARPEDAEAHPVASSPVLLAVSRDGRATLFNDREGIEPRGDDDSVRTRRPRLPGQRLERFRLGERVFAAHLVPRRVSAQETAIARLVCVGPDSRVRLVALHQPKRSALRRYSHRQLFVRWWEAIGESFDGDAEECPGVLRMHYAEALRRRAPNLWLLPLSAVFDPVEPEEAERTDAESEALRQKLRIASSRLRRYPADAFPRHLQDCLQAAHAMRDLSSALEVPSHGGVSDARDALCRHLEQALEEAFRLGDTFFFKEIVHVTSRQINFLLKRHALRAASIDLDAELRQAYANVSAVLEEASRRWQGQDADDYRRVQISRIKSLLDGDVLLHLSNPRWSGSAPGIERPELDKIVTMRTEYVHRLMSEGDPLVSLEVLRAVNVALLRAAWLRRSDQVEPNIGDFLKLLGAFARQAVDRADEALSHEFARAYAVGLIAAPQRAPDQALGLAAAHLVSDDRRFVREAQQQAAILLELMRDPQNPATDPATAERASIAIDIFNLVLRDLNDGVFPDDVFTLRAHFDDDRIHHGSPQAPVQRNEYQRLAGQHTRLREVGELYRPFDNVVWWLMETARRLQEEPEEADFSRVRALCGDCSLGESQENADLGERPSTGDLPDGLPELADHWRLALDELSEIVAPFAPKSDEPSSSASEAIGAPTEDEAQDPPSVARKPNARRTVHPVLLLSAEELGDWATRHRRWLADKRKEGTIPDPFAWIAGLALRRFRDAARGLRSGAAVQRRLVTGVLGHQLLEELDYHALELWALVRIFDPDQRTSVPGSSPHGAHQRLAQRLMDSALQIEAIPKNLRTLHGMITASTSDTEQSLRSLVELSFEGTHVPEAGSVTLEVATHLRLVMMELAANNVLHGAGEVPDIRVSFGNGVRWIGFVFSLRDPSKDDAARHAAYQLEGLKATGLIDFVERSRYARKSSGMGLYLASLAAANVGWKLSIDQVSRQNKIVRFVLEESAPSSTREVAR